MTLQLVHDVLGIGIDRDPVKALELLRETFDEGNVFDTVHELANFYDTGSGVIQDPNKATQIYEKRMNNGSRPKLWCQASCGLRLIQGKGIAKDVDRGLAFIKEATKVNSAIPWYAIGEFFRHGLGIVQTRSVQGTATNEL